MKYFFQIVVVFIFTAFSNLSAQLLVPTTYNQNLEFARNLAKEGGLSDPKLILVATATQEIEVLGNKISIDFDFDNGKSEAWIYLFSENGDANKLFAIGVALSMMGPVQQSVEIDDLNVPGLGYSKNFYIDDYQVINSDSAAKIIKVFTEFADYYNINKPFDRIFVALFVSLDVEGIKNLEPYWGIMMAKGDNRKICAVHAVDAEPSCRPEGIVSVEDEFIEGKKMSVYPNPAEDYIDIQNLNISDGFEIFDMYGRKIENFTFSIATNNLQLNITNLSSGIYFLRAKNENLMFIKN